MKTRMGLLAALSLYSMVLGCGILGSGPQIPVSCSDGPRTCADLNDSNPTGDACTFWACIDNRCQVVPKDTDQDGVLDNGCEPEGSPPDCDENDNRRFPGNTEICDYIDNNCDNEVDEGFAYGVAASNIWPFSDVDPPIPNPPDEQGRINFATRSTAQGITLAATFDYGLAPSIDPHPEGGLAVWSRVAESPDSFRLFDKRVVVMTGSGPNPVNPECVDNPIECNGTSWLTTKKYYNILPFIAGDDLGLVAAANDGSPDRYFAGLVQSEPTETLVRIHHTFHEPPSPIAGESSRYAVAAWTERGLMVLGLKSCPDNSPCNAFVHLLKRDEDTQA